MPVTEEEVEFIDAFALDELLPGMQRTWQHGLQRILLCRTTSGELHALTDLCPHARQAMAGGRFDECSITCPKHGARFDLRSGAPLNAVTPRPLQILRTRVHEGIVQIGFAMPKG